MGYTIWPDGDDGEAVEDIYREMQRQIELCRKGKFPHTCHTDALSDPEKLSVLAEEFGEVSREVTEGINRRQLRAKEWLFEDQQRLRAELIQVAAVCAAWASGLPRVR